MTRCSASTKNYAGFLFLAVLTLALAASPAAAQCPLPLDLTCQYLECRSPARGVESARWGNLQPTDVGILPGTRDNTDFNEFRDPFNETQPHWMSLDIEGDWLFAGINQGLQVWNIGGANATQPDRRAVLGRNSFPTWIGGFSEEKNPVRDVDAPEGNSNALAVAIVDDIGIAIFDSTNKSAPRPVYGDTDRDAYQVYSARIGGRDYAFLGTRVHGATVYDMTSATALSSVCLDDTPSQNVCGVYRGRLGTKNDQSYIDGAGDGSNHFVVTSGGLFQRGVDIWNVSNPSAPVHVLNNALSNDFVWGATLWRSGSNYYLGMRVRQSGGSQARIYNVSCLNTGTCGSNLGSPVWAFNLPTGATDYFVTHSTSGSRHFLYFGTVNRCAQGPNNEWLFDVTNPTQSVDISPPNYWAWYYRRNSTGFNRVAPRMGKFKGDLFYRAAFTLFDIHRLGSTGPPPVNAAFTFSPTQVYRDAPVSFFDQSTGSPDQWDWTFQDATPGNSSLQNPNNVVFNSTGNKNVTLTATRTSPMDSDTTTQSIQVLDPDANVNSVSANPTAGEVCTPITFTANGVSGNPNPTLSWEVMDSGGTVVQTAGNINPFVWDTQGVTPGVFTATVTATNDPGSGTVIDMATSPNVTLTALSPLAFTSPGNAPETLNGPPFSNGAVDFRIQATGAVEYRWNFGDGTTPVWTNDSSPTHVYALVGMYSVTVDIRNCEEGPITSSATVVDITTVAPLVADFQAQGCAFGQCIFNVNQAISFVDQSQGAPTAYAYDWTNNVNNPASCTFSGGSSVPQTSRTYTSQGTFFPCLQVSRGGQTDVFVHEQIIIGTGGGGGTPAVIVNGPTTGTVNQSLTFSATATNCTPAPTGFTWDAGDGNITTNNGTSIQVTFGSAGSRTVEATAIGGGCPGTMGARLVNITSGGGGGGGGGGNLNARFTFDPTDPVAGQLVEFDASSSSGGPDGFSWNFGDGGRASGSFVTHTFARDGSFEVSLEVSRANDPSCPPFNVCTDTVTTTVVVGDNGGGGGGNPVNASFEVDLPCTPQVNGVDLCDAVVDQLITFRSTSQNANIFEWTFGDGTAGSGTQLSHAYANPGVFTVTLVASDLDGNSASAVKRIEVEQAALTSTAAVLPWVADTTGALTQQSNVYIHNPGVEPIDVDIIYRKRGLPQSDPPTFPVRIDAQATFYAPDVLRNLFDIDNTTGFLFVEAPEALVEPVVSSFNQTFQSDGTIYGQYVPGLGIEELQVVAGSNEGVQFLPGLSDTDRRRTQFGVTNPHNEPAQYRLRFFDIQGNEIGNPSEELTVAPWGQKQFQINEIRNRFGITGVQDYRVQITQTSGKTVFAYAGLVRQGTQDPSFIRTSVPTFQETFLVGPASTPGFNQAFFQTDVIVTNPANQAMSFNMTYQNVGLGVDPEPSVDVTLQPNESLRMANLLSETWGVEDGVGVLAFTSDGADGLFPMIHGETYQDGGPNDRYGLFMPARRATEAAAVGQSVVLTGLRQKDGEANTTLWLYNPSGVQGLYDIIYLGLDGTELGRVQAYGVAGGKIRQINPSRLMLPPGGVDGGFTVRILVRSGQVIGGAQVVINDTNDPAYVAGAVR